MAGLLLTLGKQLCPVAATTLTVGDPSLFDVLSKSPSPLTVTVDPHVGHGSWLAFSCLVSPSTGFTSELVAPASRSTRPKDWFGHQAFTGWLQLWPETTLKLGLSCLGSLATQLGPEPRGLTQTATLYRLEPNLSQKKKKHIFSQRRAVAWAKPCRN